MPAWSSRRSPRLIRDEIIFFFSLTLWFVHFKRYLSDIFDRERFVGGKTWVRMATNTARRTKNMSHLFFSLTWINCTLDDVMQCRRVRIQCWWLFPMNRIIRDYWLILIRQQNSESAIWFVFSFMIRIKTNWIKESIWICY